MLRTPGPPRQRSIRQQLQRAAFAALYGRAAFAYDRFIAWLFLGEWERWQRTALADLPSTGPIVEIGAGTGALMAAARPSHPNWLAIEPSPAMLAIARRRLGPVAALVRAEAQALPIAAQAAAAVVATFPAPFIVDPQVTGEMARVLRPGGVLTVVLDGQLAPHGPRRRWRRWALGLFYGRRRDPDRSAAPQFDLPGFTGTIAAAPTRHGAATIYRGEPIDRRYQPDRRL